MSERLTFGDVDLLGIGAGFEIETYGSESGTNWGNPVPVTKAITSFLQDGALVATNRHDNREMPLFIVIKSDTAAGLAAGEAALVSECNIINGGRRRELRWTPPDGSPTSVFDVVATDLGFDFDDFSETDEDTLERRYQLTLTALPFARSVDLVSVVVEAAPPEVTSEEVDDGSSTSGWAVAPSSGDAVHTFTSSTTWTAPEGITSVKVECVGGGGGGATHNLGSYGGGGGGGGGAYASSVLTVVPGTGYAVAVGAGGAKGGTNGGGGTWSQFAGGLVRGYPGFGASGASGGSGGTVALSIGTTRTAGSNGGNGGFVSGHVNPGSGGNGAPPLGGATIGKGGSGSSGYTAYNGTAGRVRLTYTGAWQLSAGVGGIKVSKSAYSNASTWLERTGLSLDLTDLPYLRVNTLWAAGSGTPTFMVNGTPVTVVSQSGGAYWLDVTAFTELNSLRIDLVSGAGAAVFYVQEVTATNSVTAGTTGRANARQIPVAGSERAEASLSLADDEGAGLGTVLVHTTDQADALLPPLRPYLVAGPTITADSGTVSGSTSDLTTEHDFDLPAASLASGGYLLVARVKHDVTEAREIDWTAVSRMDGVDVGEPQQGSQSVDLVADTWKLVTLAELTLPPTRVGPSGIIRIKLSGDVIIDDAWLFDIENGRLTWVDCGTSKRLWLDAASVEDPVSSIWRGDSGDRADAVHAGADVQSWGVHEFVPPLMSVFTVTTESTAAELALEHYPRWHTHAGI